MCIAYTSCVNKKRITAHQKLCQTAKKVQTKRVLASGQWLFRRAQNVWLEPSSLSGKAPRSMVSKTCSRARPPMTTTMPPTTTTTFAAHLRFGATTTCICRRSRRRRARRIRSAELMYTELRFREHLRRHAVICCETVCLMMA